MTVKEVILSYHKKVPFPISVSKIRKAGYDPKQYVVQLFDAISSCTDKDNPMVADAKVAVEKLRLELS